MKNFNNRLTDMVLKVPVDDKEKPVFAKYSDLAIACINHIPQGGLNVQMMKERISLIEKMERSKNEISLEDAEHKLLMDCINSMVWTQSHKDIVAFADEVGSSTDILNSTKK